MRKMVAIIFGALMAFSVPAFAQSTVTSGIPSSGAMPPSSGPVVNYQNGLQALGQANDQNQNQSQGTVDPTTGLIVGGMILGGVVGAALLISNNQSNPVSP